MTDAERKLWGGLRLKQINGHRFRRQVPIGRYIVDFACKAAQLVIEVDGSQHLEASGTDAIRTAYLASKGYRVIRFWDNDVLTKTAEVLSAIDMALSRPHPDPPPTRGRGISAPNPHPDPPPHAREGIGPTVSRRRWPPRP